jgi:hypothetical protein
MRELDWEVLWSRLSVLGEIRFGNQEWKSLGSLKEMDANGVVDKYVDKYVEAGFGESYILFIPMTLLVRGTANHVAPTISERRDVTQCFMCVIVGDEKEPK